MSYTDLIKNKLDILDLTITFHENSLKKEAIKGRICQVFSGTLDYLAHCGANDKKKIIRLGYTTYLILMNDVPEYQTYLRLKKRRFFCHSCERTFVAETSLVEKCCSISNNLKLSIADRLAQVTSMSTITRQKKVSVSSIIFVHVFTLFKVLFFHKSKGGCSHYLRSYKGKSGISGCFIG